MNGKDFMSCVIETMEFDARNQAKLEKIYSDECEKLGLNNNNCSNSNKNSPFICVSPEPPKFSMNQITLTDDQFREFLQTIKDIIK